MLIMSADCGVQAEDDKVFEADMDEEFRKLIDLAADDADTTGKINRVKDQLFFEVANTARPISDRISLLIGYYDDRLRSCAFICSSSL